MKANWIKKLDKATEYKYKSERYLVETIQMIANDKGFDEEECHNFSAYWVSGNETVVTYNDCGEGHDLDISEFANMSKKEIVDFFTIERI